MPDCAKCKRAFVHDVALMQHMETSSCAGSRSVKSGVQAWEGYRRQENLFTLDGGEDGGDLVADEQAYNPYTGKYDCSICDRGFSKLNGLNNHLSSGVHAGAQFQCKCCSKEYKRMNQLMMHLQSSPRCKEANGSRLAGVMMGDMDAMAKGTLMITNGSQARVEAEMHFDGGAHPNPGCGGCGFIIKDVNTGRVLGRQSLALPSFGCTNNIAEYAGLKNGLSYAYHQLGIRTLRVCGDSEVVINQMNGAYQCRSENLISLFRECKTLASQFVSVIFEHVPRASNSEADALASKGVQEARENWGYA